MLFSDELMRHIPYLRRFARPCTGDVDTADVSVERAPRAFINEVDHFSGSRP